MSSSSKCSRPWLFSSSCGVRTGSLGGFLENISNEIWWPGPPGCVRVLDRKARVLSSRIEISWLIVFFFFFVIIVRWSTGGRWRVR
jgi:hypothetical protein